MSPKKQIILQGQCEMLWHFLKNPRKIGAICSSSKCLAQAMIKEVGLEKAKNIAEIGAGLGVFTQEILSVKQPQSRFFVFEINEHFIQELQKKFPEVNLYHCGAENMLKVLSDEKVDALDVIISGLPWSIFSNKEQDVLLEEIYHSLSHEGIFSTFAYIFPTPQAKNFRRKLFKKFSSVKISKIIWKNLPPACVYYCQK